MRTQASIEKLTRSLLASMSIVRPPVNVKEIASKLGARIRFQIADDDICGALFRDPGDGTPVIGVNVSHPAVRQTFSIAHEIGHLQLHDDELHIDHSLSGAAPVTGKLALRALRNRLSSSAKDPKEIEANRFAASLLMPTHFLAADLESYKGPLTEAEVASLAEAYGVSVQAMAFRLINLGVPVEYAHT